MSDPLELGLQVIGSSQAWVLRTKLRSLQELRTINCLSSPNTVLLKRKKYLVVYIDSDIIFITLTNKRLHFLSFLVE